MLQLSTKNKLILLAVVFAALVFIPLDTGGDVFLWGPFFDAGHYGAFFVLTLILYYLLPKAKLPSLLQNPYLIAITVVFATEGIQPLVERNASVTDILNGLLGVAAAGITVFTIQTARSKTPLVLLSAAVIGIQLVLLYPTWPAYQAIKWRKSIFPALATFDNQLELLLWQKSVPDHEDSKRKNPARSSNQIIRGDKFKNQTALSVLTEAGKWSGASYAAGGLSWQDYSRLVIEVHNPQDDAFDLHFRIDDDGDCKNFEDRFNYSYHLKPGANQISIPMTDIQNGPKNRQLNTNNIRWLIIFVGKDQPQRKIIIDEAYLADLPAK